MACAPEVVIVPIRQPSVIEISVAAGQPASDGCGVVNLAAVNLRGL